MKKPKKAWKPKSAAAQIAAHKKSVEATRKRDAHPAEAKAKAVKAARATLAAARKESVKVRKWSPDGDVALCSARAVAESLRLASGRPVSDCAVLDLYWSAAGDTDAGLSILDALEASRQVFGQRCEAASAPYGPFPCAAGYAHQAHGLAPEHVVHPLILGLDLPYGEPHAVVAHDGVWWSWGEPYAPFDPDWFPGAVIDEAWAVTW